MLFHATFQRGKEIAQRHPTVSLPFPSAACKRYPAYARTRSPPSAHAAVLGARGALHAARGAVLSGEQHPVQGVQRGPGGQVLAPHRAGVGAAGGHEEGQAHQHTARAGDAGMKGWGATERGELWVG